MKKAIFTLFLVFSFSVFYAQDVEQDRRVMKKVQAESDKYLFASASADSLDKATTDAVKMLSSQIMTNVQIVTDSKINSSFANGELSEETVFSQVAKTFSNVQLSDYQRLVVAKPQKKNKEYTVFVYISRERVDEILAEIKEAERQAQEAREKQASLDVNHYYSEACKAIKDYRIGDALKYLYWSYVISLDTKVYLEENGKTQPAAALIETKIDRLLNDIRVSVVSYEKVKINDIQEKYNARLYIEYVENGKAEKVTNLDYEYYDGITTKSGPRVRDGVGTLDLQYDVDEVRLQCIYKYDESETPPEIFDLVKAKGSKKFASASKIVTIPHEVKEKGDYPQTKNNPPQAVEEDIESDDTISLKPARNHEVMFVRIQAVEQAIRNKDYASVSAYFTEEGFDSFKKLIQYGNASIIGTPQYRFLDFGPLTLCRSITMQFRFRSNKQFIENVTFRFNEDNIIESLAFTLSDVSEHDILEKGKWARDSRLSLMTFLEDYQTAYALGRIDYLERIFSENALIIVGNKVEKRELNDGIITWERVRYDTLSKAQYMNRLRRHFNTKEYINLNFTETDFERASNGMEFYGIRVRQEYFSNTYGDVGYLFLLVDLRYDEPIIHVRAWQNDKLPVEALFGMTDLN